ncbi:MAG: tetratricopeptide repeat protein, partial [Candidatus Muiribacteriaceae bacterium]
VNIAYNYFIAGQCYFNLGNFKRAFANFELAVQKADTEQLKNNSLFEMAGILIIQDKPEKAVEMYQKIPESSSLYNESRLKIVDILRKEGKYDKVFELLSRIEEKGSESDFVRFTKGEILYQKGKLSDALSELSGIEEKSTYLWKALVLSAKIFREKEDPESGIKLISGHISKVPSDFRAEVYYEYARLYFEKADYDKVIDLLEKEISEKDDPGKLDDDMRIILAQAYLKIKNFAQAEANALYVAEESDSEEMRIKAQYILGNIYFYFANYKQAVLEYLKCALMAEEGELAFKSYFRAAESYQHLGRYEDAVRTYEKLIEKTTGTLAEKAKRRIEDIETVPVYEEI